MKTVQIYTKFKKKKKKKEREMGKSEIGGGKSILSTREALTVLPIEFSNFESVHWQRCSLEPLSRAGTFPRKKASPSFRGKERVRNTPG